jgi:hypothetical protein
MTQRKYLWLVSQFSSNPRESDDFRDHRKDHSNLPPKEHFEHLRDLKSLVRELILKDHCSEGYSKSLAYFLQFDIHLWDNDLKRLLLKELLDCENSTQRLNKLRDNLFLRFVLSNVLNVNNVYWLMLQSKSTDQLSDIFRTVLRCCRLLPIELKTKLFEEIHGHMLPSLDVFLLDFFSFDFSV